VSRRHVEITDAEDHLSEWHAPHAARLQPERPIGDVLTEYFDSAWMCRSGPRVLSPPRRFRCGGPSPLVKLSADGSLFYVADMTNNGVWDVDAHTFGIVGFLATGRGAHGLYPSRDAKFLYVTNRDAGTVSVVDFAFRSVVAT